MQNQINVLGSEQAITIKNVVMSNVEEFKQFKFKQS